MKIPNAMSKDRNARSQNTRQVFTKNTTVESRHSTRSTQNLHENRDHKHDAIKMGGVKNTVAHFILVFATNQEDGITENQETTSATRNALA